MHLPEHGVLVLNAVHAAYKDSATEGSGKHLLSHKEQAFVSIVSYSIRDYNALKRSTIIGKLALEIAAPEHNHPVTNRHSALRYLKSNHGQNRGMSAEYKLGLLFHNDNRKRANRVADGNYIGRIEINRMARRQRNARR